MSKLADKIERALFADGLDDDAHSELERMTLSEFDGFDESQTDAVNAYQNATLASALEEIARDLRS